LFVDLMCTAGYMVPTQQRNFYKRKNYNSDLKNIDNYKSDYNDKVQWFGFVKR